MKTLEVDFRFLLQSDYDESVCALDLDFGASALVDAFSPIYSDYPEHYRGMAERLNQRLNKAGYWYSKNNANSVTFWLRLSNRSSCKQCRAAQR